jgi:hypothetical protein
MDSFRFFEKSKMKMAAIILVLVSVGIQCFGTLAYASKKVIKRGEYYTALTKSESLSLNPIFSMIHDSEMLRIVLGISTVVVVDQCLQHFIRSYLGEGARLPSAAGSLMLSFPVGAFGSFSPEICELTQSAVTVLRRGREICRAKKRKGLTRTTVAHLILNPWAYLARDLTEDEIDKLEIYLDGKLVQSDTPESYMYTLNTNESSSPTARKATNLFFNPAKFECEDSFFP